MSHFKQDDTIRAKRKVETASNVALKWLSAQYNVFLHTTDVQKYFLNETISER